MDEIRIAREVARTTRYPGVRRVLAAFDRHCPGCGSSYDEWWIQPRGNYVPIHNWHPIVDKGSYHIVRYVCRRCGTVFKKVEEVDPDER